MGAASYAPLVEQEKHERFEKGMFGACSVGLCLKKLIQSGSKNNPKDFDIAMLDFLGLSPVWQLDGDGNPVQYDPFDTFAAVLPATQDAWVLRTVFLLEYIFDLRYAAMLAHAQATNNPVPPKPPIFLMGRFAQKLHAMYEPLHLKYLPGIKFQHMMPKPLHLLHVMAVQMKYRFEAVLPSTIAVTERTLTALDLSLDMQPVGILTTYFRKNPELCAVRREFCLMSFQ